MTIDQVKSYKNMLSGLTDAALVDEVTSVVKQREALLIQLAHNECAIRDKTGLFLDGYNRARPDD